MALYKFDFMFMLCNMAAR